MVTKQLNLAPSTATITVFDEACPEHRIKQPADWWSYFMEEIDEVDEGNAIIVGLGADGIYDVDVRVGQNLEASSGKCVLGLLKNVSERLYVGPGEEIVGGGNKPSTPRHASGLFIDLPTSTYRVSVTKIGQHNLCVNLAKVDETANNSIEHQLLLDN
jgi:hypothetical protein